MGYNGIYNIALEFIGREVLGVKELDNSTPQHRLYEVKTNSNGKIRSYYWRMYPPPEIGSLEFFLVDDEILSDQEKSNKN